MILAGVAINSLVNNGIIDKAKTATQEYKNAQDYEETQIAKYTNKIDSYVDGNRGTVTLTDEEYALFKSQFSKNGNVSISKPNTWTVGTEYDFGDGTYGQRFQGTITNNAYSDYRETLIENNYMIVNSGGWVESHPSVKGYCTLSDAVSYPNGNTYLTGYAYFTIDTCREKLEIRFTCNENVNKAPYDIWVLYTK